MRSSFARSCLAWLCLFELLAAARGWRGWRWGYPYSNWLLLPLSAILLKRSRSGLKLPGTLLAAVVAFVLQLVAASLRNRQLDPIRTLQPGQYPDRNITRLDLPLGIPALYIVPNGGAAAAVCKLHGAGDDKTEFAWLLADRLIARGMALLLIDLDGHGESIRPQRYPAMLEQVGVAVTWLRERHQRVGVIGVSLGGCLAARAVADGQAVDALAILEAPPTLHYTRRSIAREALALAQPAVLDLLRDGSLLNLIRAGFVFAPTRAEISTWDLIVALDLRQSLTRISAPLLLLYGQRDAIVPPHQAEQVRQVMPDGAVFELCRGASHLTLILQPRVLDRLCDWLAATLSSNQTKRAQE